MPTGPKKVPLKSKTFAAPKKGEHYGQLHQRLRRLLLEKFPLCQYAFEGVCEGFSVEADHQRYPATRLEDYVACCSACHRHRHRG
ncbi:MAG: hypothetical protein K2X38_01545 [Gemmataceae bacterium]|nr:hypothetical protein [Gemmataceae bacterium]